MLSAMLPAFMALALATSPYEVEVVEAARLYSTPPPPAPSCPQGMSLIPRTSIPAFCIDQFEATVEVLLNSGAPTPMWTLNAFNSVLDAYDAAGTPYRAAVPKGPGPRDPNQRRHEKPQAYISQAQAKKACKASSKRLCNLTEYRLACGGFTTRFTYPYGNTFQAGQCNTGHASPVLRVFGANALFNSIEMNNPVLDTLDNTVAFAAGNYANCTNSETFTYDQAGNLDEWVADVTPEGHGVFAGGYFVDDVINGPGCTYETVAHNPVYHDYSLGFRCCKS